MRARSITAASEHQERQVDPAHGRAAGHDRALRAGQIREQDGKKIISYCTSSYGYDIAARANSSSPTSTAPWSTRRTSTRRALSTSGGRHCIIPPNSFALARTMEYFRIPRDVLTVTLGKAPMRAAASSSTSRPSSPEWRGCDAGVLNTTPLPAKIYAGEGCAQVLCSSRATRNAPLAAP